ncbi:hypothetical protein [Streptomyces sp. NPDC059575]|uniref:hypothetical protein n=1 Tax=Streptomyces sp. NPDC059575 TaxID=3346872 RepID=UPI0036AFF8E3
MELPAPHESTPDWWSRLDEGTRRDADTHVLHDHYLMAVKTVWEALRPQGLGLHEAEAVIRTRYDFLAPRVRPPDPLDTPSLAARAAALPGRVIVVEAVWDGDTVHDWFVILLAVLDTPPGESHLATVHQRRGTPSPAARATEAGRALAAHLDVPFHFASPDVPDDEAPRWREG